MLLLVMKSVMCCYGDRDSGQFDETCQVHKMACVGLGAVWRHVHVEATTTYHHTTHRLTPLEGGNKDFLESLVVFPDQFYLMTIPRFLAVCAIDQFCMAYCTLLSRLGFYCWSAWYKDKNGQVMLHPGLISIESCRLTHSPILLYDIAHWDNPICWSCDESESLCHVPCCSSQ